MFRHIALFQLKDDANGLSKEESRQQIIQNVRRLRENIPFIKRIEVGEHFVDQRTTFPGADLCVYVELETQQDYDNYINHPVHQEIAQVTRLLVASSSTITFNQSLA